MRVSRLASYQHYGPKYCYKYYQLCFYISSFYILNLLLNIIIVVTIIIIIMIVLLLTINFPVLSISFIRGSLEILQCYA